MKGENMALSAFQKQQMEDFWVEQKTQPYKLGCVKAKDFKGIKNWSDPKAYDHFTLPLKGQWSGKICGKLGFSGN